MPEQADIGVIGLAVMGQNLILNMNDHGYRVVAYNRSVEKTRAFVAGPASGTRIQGAETLAEFVDQLARPRKVLLLVRAGDPVDATVAELLPLLDPGDLVIDGGNSNFVDTERRAAALRDAGLLFVGTGVSGGEEGARHGPSIMPGGHPEAWPLIKEIFQTISAHTEAGEACCDWVGEGGAGHFVKMVHNGIEYGDMQLIAEAYHFLSAVLGLDNRAMQGVFARWNDGALDSYLIEITADILGFEEDGEFVLDRIVDRAGQKGTGKWTGINALELGVPLTLIGEAVFARYLSAMKEERTAAARNYPGPPTNKKDDRLATLRGDVEGWIDRLGRALLAAKIISYAQGYMLMHAAADAHGWRLNYGGIAQMWRGGCIIRSAFLDDIKRAYDRDSGVTNLLMDEYFAELIREGDADLRDVVAAAVQFGIPMPAMGSALSFYDGYRADRLPANLTQAQRDYFGAHTYERVDRPAGEYFHTDWTGAGGDVASTSYDA